MQDLTRATGTASAVQASLVVHAQWSDAGLHLWGESEAWFAGRHPEARPIDAGTHPFAEDASALLDRVRGLLPAPAGATLRVGRLALVLPASGGRPSPSPRLAHALGVSADDVTIEGLGRFETPTVVVPPSHAGSVLEALLDAGDAEAIERDPGEPEAGLQVGPGVEFLASVARLARYVLAQQRFVPMLRQEGSGRLTGTWMPWLGDGQVAERVNKLVARTPPVVRAVEDDLRHDPWAVVESMTAALVDDGARRALSAESMRDTIQGQDPAADEQVAWLTGLLEESGRPVPVPLPRVADTVRQVRRWIGGLEERGASSTWRLCLRLNEPVDMELIEDLEAPPAALHWSLSFHLQPVDAPEVFLDAADVWSLSTETITVEGWRVDDPQELLLGELGRAARVFRQLERSLEDPEPIELLLTTQEAYAFLREHRTPLEEQGFSVHVPEWWESPSARLGARLRLDDPEDAAGSAIGTGMSAAAGPELGLNTLVGYRWEIAVGSVTLTLSEFEKLAEKKAPLVRVNGQWVEIRPEDVMAAVGFIRENPGGEMRVGEALRLAYAADRAQTGLPIVGLDAGGWVGALLGGGGNALPILETPKGFHGTLRPYQSRGLSWMSFLERFGFGVCLADDMGLGKTVQLLALCMHEREAAAAARERGETGVEPVGPTLLIVPMSVVGNWMYEARRFTPELRVTIHHGVERLQGSAFLEKASNCDLVITTYALANRDQDLFGQMRWHRVVLDEAQNIKNPQAKQTQAVRAVNAERRIALTGTPVENRLTELWSIMDFLNPGYLGTAAAFRKRFAVPIERYRDPQKSEQLRGLVRPFVLRRLKTDPDVVSDLPEKLETREYCHLTSEQAELYENAVRRMLGEVDQAEGMHRRGLVLSTLIRLKQICNHPSQLLKDHDVKSARGPEPGRSGKCVRLLEMLDEVLAEEHQALVFTQFRQMGHILESMIRQHTGREVLFLHGGTPQKQREVLVNKFQEGTGKHPVLILSLKAGGVGLNLTAASHVFHFDRWWNPAVEDQATDRAYRIGQTKTVHVHKYVVRGTLEERIDQMIERKTELARNIVGAGERWLTELDTEQLRDILSLRTDAIADDF
ncbi:MAG: DEAD/DEAH box helicase [Phycisphaerales bacterium]|nr:MAG: DEAD/DEAH box helicase [Phycisphaerales bacterium]